MIKKLVEFNKKDEEGSIHEENQYLNLVRDIIKENNIVCGRNGNALTTIGSDMHFDLTNMTIPITNALQINKIDRQNINKNLLKNFNEIKFLVPEKKKFPLLSIIDLIPESSSYFETILISLKG